MSYRTVTGDTWELIARKTTGDDLDASRIAAANPGVSEPIPAGTSITTPDTGTSRSLTGDDGFVVAIDGQIFKHVIRITLSRSVDAISRVQFTIPYDVDNADMRTLFKPFEFRSISITVGGEIYFTGVMIPEPATAGPNGSTKTINAYSLPGVLEDCPTPESLYPMEYKGLTLAEIVNHIINPFWLDAVLPADTGAAFAKVKSSPTAKILAFFTGLAQQRGFVISDDYFGRLVFQKSASVGSPVAVLREGSPSITTIAPMFKQRQYYSHVTGLKPAKTGSRAKRYTVPNERLQGRLRPSTFTVGDTDAGEIEDATRAKIGRMFASAASWRVTIPSWRDPSGNLWQDNTTIKIYYPSAEIFTEYEFLIRSVHLNASASAENATLDLMIPGGFAGEIPEVLPWDE